MWIKASERKPDTARRVFIKGARREGEITVALACWWDFDDRWTNFMIIDNEDTAIGIKVEYWMEITDILDLPKSDEQQDTEIDVHVEDTSLPVPVLEKRGWGMPLLSKKAHYFNDSLVSLCSKWMYAGQLEDTRHDHPDNCKLCVKKRNTLENKGLLK